MAVFLVEKKFNSLGVFISIHRASQNKESTRIRWFGTLKIKDVFSYNVQLRMRSPWPPGLVGYKGDHSPPALVLPFLCVPLGFVRTDSPGSTCRLHQRGRGVEARVVALPARGDSPVALPALRAGFGKGALALVWELLVAADSGSLK